MCSSDLFSSTAAFLGARIELDRERMIAFAPEVDLALVERHLAAIPQVCAGGAEAGSIGGLSQRERFHWLVAPRSTIIQTSPVHSGVHHDLDAALEGLFERLVRPPIKSSTSRIAEAQRSSTCSLICGNGLRLRFTTSSVQL